MPLVNITERYLSQDQIDGANARRVRRFIVGTTPDLATDPTIVGMDASDPEITDAPLPAKGSPHPLDPTLFVDRYEVRRFAPDSSLVDVVYERTTWKGENIFRDAGSDDGPYIRRAMSTVAETFSVPRIQKIPIDGVSSFAYNAIINQPIIRYTTIYTETVRSSTFEDIDRATIQNYVGALDEDLSTSLVDGLGVALFTGGDVTQVGDGQYEIRYSWRIQDAFQPLEATQFASPDGVFLDVLAVENSSPPIDGSFYPHTQIAFLRVRETQGSPLEHDPVYIETPSREYFPVFNRSDLPGLGPAQ